MYEGDRPELHNAFQRLAKAAKVDSKLKIVQSREVNAWTDGKDVFVTTSLVDKLPNDELAAVIGHELGHIVHRHVETHNDDLQTLREKMYNDSSLSGVAKVFSKVVLETAVALASQHRSRHAEHIADITGESLTRQAGYGRGKLSGALDSIAHHHESNSVLNSHPTTSKRIEVLEDSSRKKIRIRIVRKK